MAKIPEQKRMTQSMLFDERPITPHWRDLGEGTRVEAVRMLARLLLNVRSVKGSSATQDGECDE
jgi:hypothetical protein